MKKLVLVLALSFFSQSSAMAESISIAGNTLANYAYQQSGQKCFLFDDGLSSSPVPNLEFPIDYSNICGVNINIPVPSGKLIAKVNVYFYKVDPSSSIPPTVFGGLGILDLKSQDTHYKSMLTNDPITSYPSPSKMMSKVVPVNEATQTGYVYFFNVNLSHATVLKGIEVLYR